MQEPPIELNLSHFREADSSAFFRKKKGSHICKRIYAPQVFNGLTELLCRKNEAER